MNSSKIVWNDQSVCYPTGYDVFQSTNTPPDLWPTWLGQVDTCRRTRKKHRALRFNPDSWLMRIVGDPYNENARSAVEAIQWELAQKSLSLGHDAILEFGFWSRAERDEYRDVAKKLGAQCRLYYLDVPPDELKRRIEHRNRALGPEEFFVDPAALDEWAKSFEPPTAEELGAQ